MARMDAGKLQKRAERAWSRKNQWRQLRADAYRLALPMRNLYEDHGAPTGTGTASRPTPGQNKMNHVFDSTLMSSTVAFANRLQAELTPVETKWANLVPGPFVAQQQRNNAAKELNSIRDTVFAAIHISDFDTAVNEFFLDLGIGQGVMMVLEGDDDVPVRYVCVPQAQVAIEEGPFDTVGAKHYVQTVPVRLIKRMWPDAKLPEGFDKLVQDSPDKDVHLMVCTYEDDENPGTIYYDVLWKSGLPKGVKSKPHRLVERDLDYDPWIVSRWVKVAGEIEGRGPVLFALPDAKTLNKLKELVLKNASLQVAGVWTAVDDGVLNPRTVRIVPGAVIPVQRNSGALGASLQQLPVGGNFDVSQILGQDLIQNIKRIMLDEQLPPDAGPVRSATEIVARLKELQQAIGSPFGRLMKEFVRPFFEKTLAVLARKKIINTAEGGRIKINGGMVDVQVTSPLAQAQNLQDVETTVRWLQLLKALGEETFFLNAKVEDVGAWIADKLGVDPELVRDQGERKQLQGMAGQLMALNAQRGGGIPVPGVNTGGQQGGQSANDQGTIPVAA